MGQPVKLTDELVNRRFVLLFSAIVVLFAGLASRRYRTNLPSFIGEYST